MFMHTFSRHFHPYRPFFIHLSCAFQPLFEPLLYSSMFIQTLFHTLLTLLSLKQYNIFGATTKTHDLASPALFGRGKVEVISSLTIWTICRR